MLSTALIEPTALANCSRDDVRVIETGAARDDFDAEHIPGSVFWPLSELFAPDFRLQTDPARFAALLSRSGITPETLVVCSFSGDATMAGWAPWLFWILTGFGHVKTVVLNGGTPKWRAEGRPLTLLPTEIESTFYPCPSAFTASERATLPRVREAVNQGAGSSAAALLDARTLAEFCGDHFFDAPPQPGERAGHIPGARHLPHTALLQEDGSFRPVEELEALFKGLDLRPEQETITYCAVGIRAASLWFVLRHLLDFSHVRNYDGSWREWSQAEASSRATRRGEGAG